jgi:hypothetical protein
MGEFQMSVLRIELWMVALALASPLMAHAEKPQCERNAVGILYSWGIKLQNADNLQKPRPSIDAEIRNLQNGFFRECGELRTRLLSQMDLERRLNPESLTSFLKEARANMTLREFEHLLIQHNSAPVDPSGNECNAVMGLCRQDYDLLFRSYRDIGGPQFYEARCVTAKDKGRACELLTNMKKEGVDNNTDGESFISKHDSCKKIPSICSKDKQAEFKSYLNKIFGNNTHSDPVRAEHAVWHKFDSLSDCREKMQAQKDIPDSVMRLSGDEEVMGTVENYCRAIYRDVIRRHKQDECAKGKVNSECPPKPQTGGVDPNPNNCSWGVADPIVGNCNPNPGDKTDPGIPQPTGDAGGGGE